MSETHKEHPSPTKYVQIAIVLAILTAIEVALYYTEDIVGALAAPLLIILAVGKFVIVVGWFMHLRYENSFYFHKDLKYQLKLRFHLINLNLHL